MNLFCSVVVLHMCHTFGTACSVHIILVVLISQKRTNLTCIYHFNCSFSTMRSVNGSKMEPYAYTLIAQKRKETEQIHFLLLTVYCLLIVAVKSLT